MYARLNPQCIPACTCSPALTRQFDDRYVRQGLEGGKKAAYALRNAVAQQCETYAGEMEISAKVVANIQGLGRAMLRDGSVYNEKDFKDFTLGFTQAKASFDFVDVGHGKERADAKIRGMSPQRGNVKTAPDQARECALASPKLQLSASAAWYISRRRLRAVPG